MISEIRATSPGRAFLVAALVGLATAFAACIGDDPAFVDVGGAGPDASTEAAPAVDSGAVVDAGGRPDGSCSGGCCGAACTIQRCDQPGQSKTTLTGKVYDPAGRLPLFNVVVYLTDPKFDTLKPITPGLGPACDRCDGKITGMVEEAGAVLTDASGAFKLENVPAGVEVNLVMQIGKWRRVVKIPATPACTTQDLTANKDLTRLPRNHDEGDLPKIALATGGADPMECLLRKIGVDASEFGTAGDDAAPNLRKIHLYQGGENASAEPPQIATKTLAGGKPLAPAATQLWNDLDKLKAYDIVALSCEGGENAALKPPASRQALYDYARLGGRVFASHAHHYWFSSSPVAQVKGLATWTNDFTGSGTIYPEPPGSETVPGAIHTGFSKAASMKAWLASVDALTTPGETLGIRGMRHNVESPQPGLLSWVTAENTALTPRRVAHTHVTFTVPVGAPAPQVCGRVLYTSLHHATSADPGADKTNVPFPGGCTEADLTAQQKALAFLFFDLASCIQDDALPPVPPG